MQNFVGVYPSDPDHEEKKGKCVERSETPESGSELKLMNFALGS